MKKIDAINKFGGVRKLAIALGIKPQAVSQWGADVPELRAYQIQELINKNQSSDRSAA